MRVTDVELHQADDRYGKLLAYATITFDECFVVHDVKLISGEQGPFVSMPSRKVTDRCGRCGAKTVVSSPHCSGCGVFIGQRDRPEFADIAHPITRECRANIEAEVLRAYANHVAIVPASE